MAAGFSLSAPVSTLRTGRAEIGDHMMRSWDQWPQSPEAPAEEHHTMASWERPCLTAGNLATILHRNNNIANAAKCWSWPNVHWNSISLKSAILPILPINSWSSWWFECFRFWLLIVLRYSNGPQPLIHCLRENKCPVDSYHVSDMWWHLTQQTEKNFLSKSLSVAHAVGLQYFS